MGNIASKTNPGSYIFGETHSGTCSSGRKFKHCCAN
jgi:uncharacterized protein YchJ